MPAGPSLSLGVQRGSPSLPEVGGGGNHTRIAISRLPVGWLRSGARQPDHQSSQAQRGTGSANRRARLRSTGSTHDSISLLWISPGTVFILLTLLGTGGYRALTNRSCRFTKFDGTPQLGCSFGVDLGPVRQRLWNFASNVTLSIELHRGQIRHELTLPFDRAHRPLRIRRDAPIAVASWEVVAKFPPGQVTALVEVLRSPPFGDGLNVSMTGRM